MRILVTGAGGFVGRHLCRELLSHGHTVFGMDTEKSTADIPITQGDIRSEGDCLNAIESCSPDACIHLAGIAFVPLGWSNPQLVYSVNLQGTVQLLDTFRKAAPEARILVVSSGEIYGTQPSDTPLTESAPLRPENIYACSKAAADTTALLYAAHHNQAVMTARPDNHSGPGQPTSFVVPSFARQLSDISKGHHAPTMAVGNLESSRAFCDVRDVCTAYRLIIEKGTAGKAYNIASEQHVKIRTLLEKLCSIAGVQPEIKVHSDFFRPTDSRPALSTRQLRSELNWAPSFSLDATLRDIYSSLDD